MAGKLKLQILKNLEYRLEKLTDHSGVIDILGFKYGKTINYTGLTTNRKYHRSGLEVLGLCFMDGLPEIEVVKCKLEQIREDGSLFLIYFKDEQNSLSRNMFSLENGNFLSEQPVIVVCDEAKIYMHSALIKLNVSMKLDLWEDGNVLQPQENIITSMDGALKQLTAHPSLKLKRSTFSSTKPLETNDTLETLYSTLDVPDEVKQKGEYLPNMKKEDKLKEHSKWRNRMKDSRAPLEFTLFCGNSTLDAGPEEDRLYGLDLEEYFYLAVTDTIARCTRQLINLIEQKFELTKLAIENHRQDKATSLERAEIKSCAFKPEGLGHLIQAIYLLPDVGQANFKKLQECREAIHEAYLLDLDQPAVRYSQRIRNMEIKNQDQIDGFLCNVHESLADKSGVKGRTLHEIIRGTYTYHHYLQNRAKDNGWGCAYRSVQTIISWLKHQGYIYSPDVEMRKPAKADKSNELRLALSREERVPTHEEIQQVLVDVGDKAPSFVGSQKWIGSQEVCFVLDHLYNIESKFISVSSGSELVYKARELGNHIGSQSTPVMIGGGVLAHTIIGVDFNEKNGDIAYLILDPHYTGGEDLNIITKKGWCGWKKSSFWDKAAFYNVCLPQRPHEY